MISTILLVALIGFQIFCNVYVALTIPVQELRQDLIVDQKWYFKIMANTFYALAWFLKIFIRE